MGRQVWWWCIICYVMATRRVGLGLKPKWRSRLLGPVKLVLESLFALCSHSSVRYGWRRRRGCCRWEGETSGLVWGAGHWDYGRPGFLVYFVWWGPATGRSGSGLCLVRCSCRHSARDISFGEGPFPCRIGFARASCSFYGFEGFYGGGCRSCRGATALQSCVSGVARASCSSGPHPPTIGGAPWFCASGANDVDRAEGLPRFACGSSL